MKRDKITLIHVVSCAYILMQILGLFLLRREFLMTVYQTVAAYAAVSLVGLAFLFAPYFIMSSGLSKWVKILRDYYLLFWSGVHAVIVLGFLTCGSYYLTLTQVTLVQIVNIFLGIVLYWFLYLITGRVYVAVGCGNLIIGIMGTLNLYLVRFRGVPFQLSDIKALGTATTVAQGYDFTPNVLLVMGIADLALWFVIWLICDRESGQNKRRGLWNPISISFTVILVCGCIALPVGRFDRIYTSTMQFAQDTYLAQILAEMMGSTQTLPEDYSPELAEQILADFRMSATMENQVLSVDEPLPNIVVIMNEAFSDLRVLGSLETEEPVLPFWDSLDENVIRGLANVSVLGGSTANSEYEFLTSDPIAVYPNGIPYNSYFNGVDTYPSLVSGLKALGYDTIAFHPYLASGWNRRQVYRAMQFDRIVFLEDMEEEPEHLRHYASDAADYAYIRQCFLEKETGVPLFFFNVTMQNHGGYTYTGEDFQATIHLSGDMRGVFPETEQYLSLLRASDQALEELLTWFSEYEEPVIVVMFGDHQPRLEDGFYEYLTGTPMESWSPEQYANQYKTPFIIWHNYSSENANIGDVSLNYLASLMLQDAGLPMSEYQWYALEQYKIMPVLNSVGIWDSDGCFQRRGNTEFIAMSSDYRILTYYHTVDKEHRLDEPFLPLSLQTH